VKAAKVEEKWIQPDVERNPDWVQHPNVLEGQDALRQANFKAARTAFEKALSAEPKS
jgi:hypothetical protein